MTYRHQIPANGWKAVLSHEDGSHSTIPLVCFEILCCADEEEEDEFSSYEPETSYHVKGEPRDRAKPTKGSAMEAVGLAFFETHPQWKPQLALSEVHSISGFLGYLPPGKDLEEWLRDLPVKKPVDSSDRPL